MTLADALDTVRRVAAVRTTDVQTLALARGHGRVLAEPIGTASGSTLDAIAPGCVLTPLRIAHAAAAGVEVVRVRRRPTVAVFAVEGVDAAAVAAAQALLVGLLRADGLEPTGWPVLPADARSVEIAIRDAGCAFDAIVVCADANGRERVDAVLAGFGDVRVDRLDVDGAAQAACFGTLDAACVIALPLDALAIAGAYLTLGRALIDALEVRTDPRATRIGTLYATHPAPAAFAWARTGTDAGGACAWSLPAIPTDADAVLLPLMHGTDGAAGACIEALPLPAP